MKPRYLKAMTRLEVPDVDEQGPRAGHAAVSVPPKRVGDERQDHSGIFSRMGRNIAWLLGGRGFAAIVSLLYLAIAARALEPEGFGRFTLVLTFGQMIANLVQFQSWKSVLRYGAPHVEQGRHDHLARLLGFTATLDWLAAFAGAGLAVAGAFAAGPLFHWSGDEQSRAALFSATLLLSTGATQGGVLRLFDRFDLLTLSEAVAPLVRLVGASAAWLAGGGVGAFLGVWAVAALAQAGAAWIILWTAQPVRLSIGRLAARQALSENRRLIRFMVQTNLSNSLNLFWLHIGTLAVGAFAGPAAAGGFRLADRMVRGIASAADTLTRVLYPELARLVASNNRHALARVFKRTSLLAFAVALAVVAVTGLFGSDIIQLVAGRAFRFAHVYLFLLAIAAAVDLCGFALEPFHIAHGRSGRVLRSRAVGATIYVALLAALVPRLGAPGAAIAAIVASVVIVGQLAQSAAQILRQPRGPTAT